MEEIKKLTDDELDAVTGGFEHEGQEYDSVQLLDMYVDYLNYGAWGELLNTTNIILMNCDVFLADIEKARRTIPEQLRAEIDDSYGVK